VTGDRQIRLRPGTRTASVPAGHGREVVRYTGIAVTRVEDGEPVEQTWVPVGPAPTHTDDEALIAAWHEALLWSRPPTDG
jgi:hypothetical protein